MTRRADGDHARRYLLGELPDAERDVFEEEYFSQDETLGALEAAEDDLIDAYCRDALSPEHRQALEARSLRTESGRQRLKFAEALATAATRSRDRRAGIEAHRWRRQWLGRAAVLSALVAGVVLILRLGQLESELRRAQAKSEAARQATASELERLRSRTADLEKGSAAGAVTRVASLVLRAGSRRDFDPLPRLVLGPETAVVELTLLLKADPYPTYRAALQTVEGRDLLIRDGLQGAPTGGGRSLHLALPADALAPGHYVVTVRGSQEPPPDAIAEYVFQVAPRP
ncbi:MAG: hypothetical protein ACHQKZ_07795 [Solirubrobacterales bacterium]